MKKKSIMQILVNSLIMALMFFLVSINDHASGAENAPIKIAVNCPLTGNSAEYGQSFQRALNLAVSQWNDRSGVLNRKIELVYGDSKADANEAAILAQKVTSDPTIFAQIGDFNSAACMSAQPIYAAAEMIQISPTCSHINFASASKWSFECLGTQVAQGQFMAKWAYDEGYRKIAIIFANSDWGVSVRNAFTDAFEQFGGKVIAEEAYFDGESDFTAVLTKLRGVQPDALYMGSYYNEASAIVVQRMRLGWNIPVFSTGTIYAPSFLELSGSASEGIFTNVGFFPDDPPAAARGFIKQFNEMYNMDPDYWAACAYDTFNVLMEAIQRAGVLETHAVRDELAKTKGHVGVTGEITFDENGDALKTYVKLTIKEGKFVAVK
jgi:branched-chain amino acid transport system substrate-binding protein